MWNTHCNVCIKDLWIEIETHFMKCVNRSVVISMVIFRHILILVDSPMIVNWRFKGGETKNRCYMMRNECDKFDNLCDMSRHLTFHHERNHPKTKHQCDQCEFSPVSKSTIKKHIKTKHETKRIPRPSKIMTYGMWWM